MAYLSRSCYVPICYAYSHTYFLVQYDPYLTLPHAVGSNNSGASNIGERNSGVNLVGFGLSAVDKRETKLAKKLKGRSATLSL
jgi:hypothetical protein